MTTKKTPLIKWIVIGVAVIVLGIGGFFGYGTYQNYLADKIYAPSERVDFSDFTITTTKADFTTVDLPLDKGSIVKYGDLDKQENCSTFSKERTWDRMIGEWSHYGPSEFNICVRRNSSRQVINQYSSENKKLIVDFNIKAKSNVNTKDVQIDLVADSGRNLGERVDSFNANQLFAGGAQHIYDDSQSTFGAPGKVMSLEYTNEPYTPYNKSDLGGDLNTGIERKGYIYADIRNSENSVDLKVTYHGQTRVVRILQ